jgi:arginine N-succinyltransferase
MYLIRPIKLEDLDALFGFAEKAALGINSLPKNRELLKKIIEHSVESFNRIVHTPDDEYYTFVLENLETKEIVGTCSINARTGTVVPLHFYKITTIHPHSNEPIVPKEMQMLQVVTYSNGPTEVCGIFIKHHMRKEKLGRLLSFCRFLFIASFPQRFKRTIIAQMRGVIDAKHSTSPFWEGVGSNFTTLKFPEVMRKMETDRAFIKDILPQNPIYVSLLPKFAQKVMEKVHKTTKPALKMLTNIGFKLTGEIDVFDGGPSLKADVGEIECIKNSNLSLIREVVMEDMPWNKYLICNNVIDFKACMGQLKRYGKDEVMITKDTAEALHVKKGDYVRWTK